MHQDQPQGGIQCYLMKFNENDLKLIVQKEVQNASKIKFPMFTKMTNLNNSSIYITQMQK